MTVTSETRREARNQVDANRNRQAVLGVLRCVVGMTAHEIAHVLHWDVTAVRPRLTELRKSGEIVATGERRKTPAGKSSAVFAVVVGPKIQKELF